VSKTAKEQREKTKKRAKATAVQGKHLRRPEKAAGTAAPETLCFRGCGLIAAT